MNRSTCWVAWALAGLLTLSLGQAGPADRGEPPRAPAAATPASRPVAGSAAATSQAEARTPASMPATQAEDDGLLKPPGYYDWPLGPEYDTPAKAGRLKNVALRNWMIGWLQARAEYADQWRQKGDKEPYVRTLRDRMNALKMLIEDRAADLKSRGESLE